MTRFSFFVFCFLFFVFSFPGCRRAEDTWRRLEDAQREGETAVLRIGVDPTYPPFAVADGGGVWGLEIDLAQALAQELGVTAQFTYFGFDGLYDALLTEQVDVLISALVIDLGRTRDFAYSDPYFNAGEVLVVRVDEKEISGWRDLNGRILAVELGSQGHMEANRWQRRLLSLTVQTHDTAAAALQAVSVGQAAAALVDHAGARLFTQQQPQAALQRLPDPITVKPYALVVRKADGRLLRHLNEALAHLQKSGQLDQVLAEWLGK